MSTAVDIVGDIVASQVSNIVFQDASASASGFALSDLFPTQSGFALDFSDTSTLWQTDAGATNDVFGIGYSSADSNTNVVVQISGAFKKRRK